MQSEPRRSESAATPFGYAGLIAAFDLPCPLPRRSLALADVGRRRMEVRDGVEWLLRPRRSGIQLPSAPIGHLGLALKHEELDLRILHCLFARGVRDELVALIPANPKGQYFRKVDVRNETAYLYRYFDATRQAEYLVDRIEHMVQFAMPAELRYLQQFDEAKRRVAAVADLPDRLASLLIQLCVQAGGTLSARKRADFFPDADDAIIAELEEAVRASGIVDPSAPATD